MPEKAGHFDAAGFYEALESTRMARRLTWRRVAGEAGVSPSTLTRMAQGRRPDVDSLAALATWSGLSPDDFIRSDSSRPGAEPLAVISAHLRADPNLTAEGAAALEEVIRATYRRLRREPE